MPLNAGPETITVEVPELVSFHLELADVGSRFLALAIDTGIRLAALMGMVYVWFALDDVFRRADDDALFELLSRYLTVGAMLGLVAFWFGYHIFFEAVRGGRSPGKAALKLRVVTDFGGPVGWTESFIRNTLRLVDSLPLFYGVGLLTMLLNSRAQRLGDLAAGTLVVRDSAGKRLQGELLVGLRELALPEAPDVALPTRPPLSARDHDLLMSYFTRRAEFSPEGRASLARRIVEHLWPDHIGKLRPEDPEAVLAAYVQRWRRENPVAESRNGASA